MHIRGRCFEHDSIHSHESVGLVVPIVERMTLQWGGEVAMCESAGAISHGNNASVVQVLKGKA